ncbi:MAG TPA: glycosyltransferase family 39 protein [Candidatus Udaeobacter sp.]|nr:glycosyltransferase family 39 protein [Candidatus Udaeobacter sp.]
MTVSSGLSGIDHQSSLRVFVQHALLFVGCLLFHIAGTWSLPLIDRDEPRFAEASREMIQRSDYVVPYFNNQLRLDKPPLTYWAQTVSYRIFGENDFAARFPSAVAAALVAITIPIRGLKIGGGATGWRAAIIFTLCLQTFVHAKAAVADMWLALFVTTAHWSALELLRDGLTNTPHQAAPAKHQTTHWWFLFYVSLALGFLAKGPIAWTPLLTVAATRFYAHDLQLGRRFKFVRGIALMLVIVAAWGIPALIRTNGEFLRIGIGRHVIGRSFATMEGHGLDSLGGYILLLPFYFVTVFVSFFPWSIKLPWLLKRLWHKRDNIDCYLFSGAAIIFIIFSLIKTKLPHYTLPAFGMLALLVARHWTHQEVSVGGSEEASPSRKEGNRPAAVARRRSPFTTIAVATASVLLAIALVVPPLVARFFPAYQLFKESRAHLQPNMQFAAVEFQEPSLVWYFRSELRGFLKRLNKKNAAEFMSKPGPRLIVVPASLAPTLFPNQQATTFSTRGFNIPKGKEVDLTVLLKPE